jgi:hypothetical protein
MALHRLWRELVRTPSVSHRSDHDHALVEAASGPLDRAESARRESASIVEKKHIPCEVQTAPIRAGR